MAENNQGIPIKCDVLFASSPIDSTLYNNICDIFKGKDIVSTNLLFNLVTDGGDPHFAFKISRFLQGKYQDGYFQVISNRCKSAGTLIACGAKKLFFVNFNGELGPLDTQRVYSDELAQKQVSALNVFKAIEYIVKESTNLFFSNFLRFRSLGLSPKNASLTAANMIKAIYEPICSQIDPMVVGEFSRNLEVAKEYMMLLNQNGQNIINMQKIIYNYPDHNFVIDYNEAKITFRHTELIPTDLLDKIFNKQEKLYFTVYDGTNNTK